jgi:hypothetical protein
LPVKWDGLGGNIDRPAQSLGLLFRPVGFGHGDGTDHFGGQCIEGHRATAQLRAGRHVGGRQAYAAKRRARQIRIQSANVDEASLAGVSFELYARNDADRIAAIHDRQLADFVICHDIDDVLRLPLRRARLLFRCPLRGYGDFLQGAHLRTG